MRVAAVSRSPRHRFSKTNEMWIRLVAGLGVEGDAHSGETVRHRHLRARDPHRPNLRQVHLLHAELLTELRAKGFALGAGEVGENVLTEDIDLLGLTPGTRLRLGESAVVGITGLRDPCVLMDRFRPGLMRATLERTPEGGVIRKAGVMGIVLASGEVRSGDPIRVEAPEGPHRPLEVV